MAIMDLEYIEIDGLLYPNIELDDAQLYQELGKYGRLRLAYLHESKPQLYRELLFSGKLAQHCAYVEQAAFEISECIRAQYLARHPAPEEGIERIQVFKQAQMVADKIVHTEMICV